MDQLTDKELKRKIESELSTVLGVKPIYMMRDDFFQLHFEDKSLHEKFGPSLCVPTSFWNMLIKILVEAQKSHKFIENSLRHALDQFNGIRPDCGHEWKYTEARGDEFESCLQCRVDTAEKTVHQSLAITISAEKALAGRDYKTVHDSLHALREILPPVR